MVKKYLILFVLAALPYLTAEEKYSPMLKDFLETVAAFPVERPENLNGMQWESRAEYRIIFSNSHYYSFKAVEFSYTGGAHGSTRTSVGTIFRGKKLKLADLGDQKKLRILWEKAIAAHFKKASYAEHFRQCSEIFKPFMTENFYLDGKGIHFVYDPIEIDCYAAGTIDIFVPWSEGEWR